jgi:hypothetical protein
MIGAKHSGTTGSAVRRRSGERLVAAVRAVAIISRCRPAARPFDTSGSPSITSFSRSCGRAGRQEPGPKNDTAREPGSKTRTLAVPGLRSVVGRERVGNLLARPTLRLGFGLDSGRVRGRKRCRRTAALICLNHRGRDTTARRNLVAMSSGPLTNCGSVVPARRRGTRAAPTANGAATGTTGCPGVRSQNSSELRGAFRAQIDLEALAVEGEGDRLVSLATIKVVDEPYTRDACHLSLPSIMPSRVTQFSTPAGRCQITRGCRGPEIPRRRDELPSMAG